MRDRQLEVVGRELQLAIPGREQDIAQDREGALGQHNSADHTEAFGEVLLLALELHGGCPFLRPGQLMVPGAAAR